MSTLIFLTSSLAMKWYFSVTNLSFLRDSSMIQIFTCVKIHQAQNYSSPEESIALSNSPREWTNVSELIDVHQCNKVGLSLLLFCVLPLYDFLSFLIHCCLCFWNQHCLGWEIFCTYSRFPEACVSERQISRIVWTIRNSRFPNIHILLMSTPLASVCTPEIRWADQHPEFILLSFPGSHSRVSRTPRVVGLLEESVSHRYAVSRDETTCASFHFRTNKIWWRAFFQIFSFERIRVPNCVILHRILSFTCNINTNELLLQILRLLFFFGNIGLQYAHEYDLLHGKAVSTFFYSCFFLLWAASQFFSMRQAIFDLDVMSSEFPSTSLLGLLYLFRGVSLNNVNIMKSSPWLLIDCLFLSTPQ